MKTAIYDLKGILEDTMRYYSHEDDLEIIYKYFRNRYEHKNAIPDWMAREINNAQYENDLVTIQAAKNGRDYEMKMSISKALRRWGAKDMDFLSRVVQSFYRVGPYVEYKVVSGDDIIKYYQMSSRNRDDELYSCMVDNPNDCLQFYVDNNLKLVVGLNGNGEMVSKCLLWELEDGVYVDRRYERKGDILQYIKDNYNVKGVYPKDKYLLNNREVYVKEYSSALLICPYLDSAKYIINKNGKYYLLTDEHYADVYPVYGTKYTDGYAEIYRQCYGCKSILENNKGRYYGYPINDFICADCVNKLEYDHNLKAFIWPDDYKILTYYKKIMGVK